jgi:uncharacterized protein DUF4136
MRLEPGNPRTRVRVLIAAAIASLTAASAIAQKISFDYDKAADFNRLTTFAFKDGTPSGNPLVDGRIRSAISGALGARAMSAADAAPDVFVVTHLTFDRKKDIATYSTSPGYGPYGWHWGAGWGMTDLRVREITGGTLIIDIVDARKGALVWRGIAVNEVRGERNVTDAVERILKNFPPTRTT